jgi:hypothetical protein
MAANPNNSIDRIRELEGTLVDLRAQLEAITSGLARDATNTSLVIGRVNVMKRIMVAQSEIDTLRATLKQT